MSDDQTQVAKLAPIADRKISSTEEAEGTLPEGVKGFKMVMKDLMAHNHVQLVFTGPSSLISEVRVDEQGMELLSSFVEVKQINLAAKEAKHHIIVPIVSDYKYEVTMGPLTNPKSIKGLLGGDTTDFRLLVEPAYAFSHKLGAVAEQLSEVAKDRADAASWTEKFWAERNMEKASPSVPTL